MVAPVYLGDETSAAGWRLAGVRTVLPEEGDEAAALAAARAHATLVLVSVAVAARIPEAALRAAQAALLPLTLVVPDLSGLPVPDLSARLRHQLGLDG
ncbi:MAG: V-type ATP synthase subunit F [Casimicrobiaceae bacterium]